MVSSSLRKPHMLNQEHYSNIHPNLHKQQHKHSQVCMVNTHNLYNTECNNMDNSLEWVHMAIQSPEQLFLMDKVLPLVPMDNQELSVSLVNRPQQDLRLELQINHTHRLRMRHYFSVLMQVQLVEVKKLQLRPQVQLE